MRSYCIPLLFISVCSSIWALDERPWFGDVYEFRLDSSFTYSRFDKVEGAFRQPHGISNNYVSMVGIGFMPADSWDLEIDLEMAQTPREQFGFRSSAIQARYQFLDDIAGDPVSATMGLSIRGVGNQSVQDVSSPYSSYANYEVHTAIGKEHVFQDTWTLRGYGLVAVGQANHGYPWIRSTASFEGNIHDTHRLELFSVGYFGFGHHRVDAHHFHGWGNIRHQSVDVGGSYKYKFDLWGVLSLSYAYRVYAHLYPQNEQTLMIRYELPFSLF